MSEEKEIDTSGFYKNDKGVLRHAPNFVHSPSYSLTRETKAEKAAMDGWQWFDSVEEAATALKVDVADLVVAVEAMRPVGV